MVKYQDGQVHRDVVGLFHSSCHADGCLSRFLAWAEGINPTPLEILCQEISMQKLAGGVLPWWRSG